MSQIVPNQDNPISVFDAAGINEKVVEQYIPILCPMYERSRLDVILDNMMGATIVKSDNRKFQIYRQDNTYAQGTIQSRQVMGSSLKLIFTESTFEGIALGNLVYANNGCEGVVATSGPGYVVLNFVQKPDGAAAFVTADFAAGEAAIDGGDQGDVVSRVQKQTKFYIPEPTPYIIQQMSNSAYIGHDEMNTKTYMPAANGKQEYYYQKQADALAMLHRQYTKRMYQNTPALFSGNKPISASPINQILTQGGIQQSLGATDTFTGSQFRGWMRQYIAQGGFTTGEALCLFGPQLLGNFQECFEDANIKYVGMNNTVGGATVKGINFMEYAFMGLSLKVVAESCLGDLKMWAPASNGFSSKSNTGLVINTAPVATKNMGPVPFATSRYFGNNADIRMGMIKGIVDENGNMNQDAANPQAGISYEYFWNKCNVFSNPRGGMYIGQ